jgi:hypothetical protein
MATLEIECGPRDTKDLRFGMRMGSIHVSTPARRDRLWLLHAPAITVGRWLVVFWQFRSS